MMKILTGETPEKLKQLKEKRLMVDKIFDIKEVFDKKSLHDNFKVLKEVVQLLEKYQIRYPRRQRHLSDFFERLLTTGLKQEAGQFFTPPPITRFIVRSMPVKEKIIECANTAFPTLPAAIDYACGSGHFLTELLETYQDIINTLDTQGYHSNARKRLKTWSKDGEPYSWASTYVYGIEKDYRLVKVAKVGCYFYGDGLAQIFHADGLDSFSHSEEYSGLLKENKTRARFDIVVSNPPYSVDAFRGDLCNQNAEEDFALYPYLTDASSEIECLFAERTGQLLKEGGVAGIILPSSILSNTGIYLKAREIILQEFEIIAIAELGSNTFMATGTNTVILFLRKRNRARVLQIKESIAVFLDSLKDITIGGIENAVSKYARHVWGVPLADYGTLYKKVPNAKIKETSLYKDYHASYPPKELYISDETPEELREKMREKYEEAVKKHWENIIEKEKEKMFYFILSFPQTVVLVRTGKRSDEKRFLGYEFSNRRGHEGIHPIECGKRIEDCTRLFDDTQLDNPEKASTYIYRAFNGDVASGVDASLRENVSRVPLIDMLTFNRVSFDKDISTSVRERAARVLSER
jgi:type I restriction enzyme M protein